MRFTFAAITAALASSAMAAGLNARATVTASTYNPYAPMPSAAPYGPYVSVKASSTSTKTVIYASTAGAGGNPYGVGPYVSASGTTSGKPAVYTGAANANAASLVVAGAAAVAAYVL